MSQIPVCKDGLLAGLIGSTTPMRRTINFVKKSGRSSSGCCVCHKDEYPSRRLKLTCMADSARMTYGCCPDDDADGDVDLAGFAALQSCFTGSEPLDVSPGCRIFDFASDGDVDLDDYAAWP